MTDETYAEIEMNYRANNCFHNDLNNFLSKNGKFITADSSTGFFSEDSIENIFHYKSSTIVLARNNVESNINLKVISDDNSKAKEILGELEKVLLGK